MGSTVDEKRAPRATRLAILETAGALFARKGLDGVGVREIVKEAGTSLSSVNYHFTSKEKLYVACLRHVFDDRLGLSGVFGVLDDVRGLTPQGISDLLGSMVYRTLVAFLGPGTPAWYGELMVRSRMEMHHLSPRALYRLEEPLKLRRFVQERCPHLSAVFVEHWFISLMAQLQYYIMEKEAVLLGFGLTSYDNDFLSATARFMAQSSALTLGLPMPNAGCFDDSPLEEACG